MSGLSRAFGGLRAVDSMDLSIPCRVVLRPGRPGRCRVIADFSLGMTKRSGLAVALLHAPRVLILDEPLGSLDPVNTEVMEAMLQRYRSGGGTVVSPVT